MKSPKNLLLSSAIGKFLNFFWFLFFFVVTNADIPAPENVLFLVYDRECQDNRTITEVLLESKTLSNDEVSYFEDHLNVEVNRTRSQRLQESPVEHPGKRRLGSAEWQETRDILISTLNVLKDGKHRRKRAADEPETSSVLYEFFPSFAIDAVVDTMPVDGPVFNASRNFPCLAFPVQRDVKQKFELIVPGGYNQATFWHLAPTPLGIGAKKAWEARNKQRKAPVVAVLDSGCSSHPYLKDNVCTCHDDCFGANPGVRKNHSFTDTKGHGTAVAGMIASNGDDAPGVCPDAKIMCVNIADDDGDYFRTLNIVEGLQYVFTKRHIVKIVNHSYGGHTYEGAEFRAHQDMRDAGILSIVSAGNYNCDIDTWDTPECVDKNGNPYARRYPQTFDLDNILVVGSSTRSNGKAGSSNYGKRMVDVFAPGDQVGSLCLIEKDGCFTRLISGTSFSAPAVAGVAANLLAEDPSLTYLEIKNIIMETSTKYRSLEPLSVTGGVVNMTAAMERVQQLKRNAV